jgi:hypothetical protein
MVTPDEVREVLSVSYREIGGNPDELVRIAPRYGTWDTALKYEVTRSDSTTTAVWRKDLEDRNYDEVKSALLSFSPPVAKSPRLRTR